MMMMTVIVYDASRGIDLRPGSTSPLLLPSLPHSTLHLLSAATGSSSTSARPYRYIPLHTVAYRYVTLHAVTYLYRYWQLFDQLTPEAAENVAWKNAQRMYFDDWKVPSGEGKNAERRYLRQEPMYETECLDPSEGKFVPGDKELDTHGKY